MPVDFKHPDFKRNIERWQMVTDCVSGSDSVKKRTTRYLPMPDPDDQSEANKARYETYKQRAVYVNVTGRTVSGLVGTVFRKNPTIELPDTLDYLHTNADGLGLSLTQMSKHVLRSVLVTGRHGLLVDYPTAPIGRTRRDDLDQQTGAYITSYAAPSIINWRVQTINNIKKLSLVVLYEKEEIIDKDGFGSTFHDRYRVLKLDNEGYYTQEIYRNNKKVESYEPRDYNGQRLTYIPFIFVGSNNNSPDIDDIPVYDLAGINLSHYRNSADFEETIYLLSNPTLFVSSGLDADQWTEINGKDRVLKLGSRHGYNLGENGSAELLQIAESQLAQTAMKHKEEQMIMLGAKLIQRQTHNVTAEEARIRHQSEISILDNIVANVSDGLTLAIQIAAHFNGVDINKREEIDFKLNDEYYEDNIDPQQVMAEIQLYQNGIKSKKDIRDTLRKSGNIDPERTDEEIDDALEQDPGSLGI